MREIKFRVWSKYRNVMEYDSGHKADRDLYVLMQYTGCNDRNDKEIYQDDIVRCGYGTGKVVWMLGGWWVQWIDDKEASMELLGLNNKMRRQREDDERFEVIGNIYETPID